MKPLSKKHRDWLAHVILTLEQRQVYQGPLGERLIVERGAELRLLAARLRALIGPKPKSLHKALDVKLSTRNYGGRPSKKLMAERADVRLRPERWARTDTYYRAIAKTGDEPTALRRAVDLAGFQKRTPVEVKAMIEREGHDWFASHDFENLGDPSSNLSDEQLTKISNLRLLPKGPDPRASNPENDLHENYSEPPYPPFLKRGVIQLVPMRRKPPIKT